MYFIAYILKYNSFRWLIKSLACHLDHPGYNIDLDYEHLRLLRLLGRRSGNI